MPHIKATICNFSIVTSICPKYYCTQLCQKQLLRNLASVNLTLKKLNFLLSSTKIFCISVFNANITCCQKDRQYALPVITKT